jgi:uncharacterized protein (UPF0335 family)
MKESKRLGNLSESRFEKLCALQSWSCTKSSREDDMFKHIDYYVTTGSEEIAVDVKHSRNIEQIWIELKNVRGNIGWLYGEATHICFDVPLVSKMVVVERLDLATYIAENCKKEFVKRDEAYLKLYTRQGRADILTFIKLHDLFYLSSFKIYRYE